MKQLVYRKKLNLIKKTVKDTLSIAERRRYEDIVEIQRLLAEGYAPVEIKELLHTTYFRIRRYATGDPDRLCRFEKSSPSKTEAFRSEIIELLYKNMPYKQALEEITKLGYSGKRTAFQCYCRKLIAELDIPYKPRRNAAGVQITRESAVPSKHYLLRKEFMRFLWSGKEIAKEDVAYIYKNYPATLEIQKCIQDFRNIYEEHSPELLEEFIERYSASEIKPIRSFASGLHTDKEAVTNSVTSELSNGFVEGINNKIKVIKRMMYGRAKLDLLRIRILLAH